MKHENEKAKLKQLVPEEVYGILKENQCWVAGGAITSLFTNNPVNDIDVYFRSEGALKKTLVSLYRECEFELICTNYTDKSILFVEPHKDLDDNPLKVQFIVFRYFNTAQDIFNSFDFTACMGAYDFSTEEFVLHEDFLKHNSQRYLKYNTDTDFPLLSALRVEKYKDKRYEISKTEMVRVLLNIATVGLDGWEDAKEHIGGVYGLDMEDVFDEDKPFSLEELMLQMGNIRAEAIKGYETPTDVSLPQLLMQFTNTPMKFYKAVLEETDNAGARVLRSSICPPDKAITYIIGETVNGGKYGIYARAQGYHPAPSSYFSTAIYLELEVSGKSNVKMHDKEVQLLGDVKVIREVSREEIEEKFNAPPF